MSALVGLSRAVGQTLLRVKVSTNGLDSSSLKVLDEFTSAFLEKHPGVSVIDRDVNDIPHLTVENAAAGRVLVPQQSPAQREAFSLANELTEEVVAAAHIVVATPMHNWGPPSALKAWVDRIVNCRTFYVKDEHITNTQVSTEPSLTLPCSIIV